MSLVKRLECALGGHEYEIVQVRGPFLGSQPLYFRVCERCGRSRSITTLVSGLTNGTKMPIEIDRTVKLDR